MNIVSFCYSLFVSIKIEIFSYIKLLFFMQRNYCLDTFMYIKPFSVHVEAVTTQRILACAILKWAFRFNIIYIYIWWCPLVRAIPHIRQVRVGSATGCYGNVVKSTTTTTNIQHAAFGETTQQNQTSQNQKFSFTTV